MMFVVEDLKALYIAYKHGKRLPARVVELPYIFAAILVLALLLFANKMWATNDDAGMAMVVEGYGVAASPSAGMIYSSVVWGWLLTRLPHFSSIETYTAVTYALLLASWVAIALSLRRLRAPSLLAAAALVGMYTTAIFHPQFTIVGGYLAVSGLAVMYAWKDSDSSRHLFVAGLLLLFSGLIRTEELLLVLGVCLPFLFIFSWREIGARQRRGWFLMAIALVMMLCASRAVDHIYYSSDAWTAFNQMNDIRLAFTDYKLSTYFSVHEEILQPSKLTANDISLISHWFYVDGRVFNRENFEPLLAAIPWTERVAANLKFWRQPLEVVTAPQLLPLIYLFLLTLLCGYGWKRTAFCSLLLLAVGMLVLFLLGRGGIARIYVPPAAALLILSIATMSSMRRWLLQLAGAVALVFLVNTLIQDWNIGIREGQNQRAHGQLVAQFCKLPQHDLLLIWGNGYFQYNTLYDQDSGAAQGCGLHLYPISTLSLTPYSTDNLYRVTGERNPVDALLHGQTLYIYTEPYYLDMLNTYLQEHYGSTLSYNVVVTVYKSRHIYAMQATPASMTLGSLAPQH